jgi:hypothetical protein
MGLVGEDGPSNRVRVGRSVEDTVNDASEFRQAVQRYMPNVRCCVCGCVHPADEVKSTHLPLVPNVSLLKTPVEGCGSGALPHFTKWLHPISREVYSILHHPDTITKEDDAGVPFVNVCCECLGSLKDKRIPRASYLKLDPGTSVFSRADLPDPTPIEQCLLSIIRPTRTVTILRPANAQWRPADTCIPVWRGHVVAVPNTASKILSNVLPHDFSAIPDSFHVVLLSHSQSVEDTRRLLSNHHPFLVRGNVVVAWARHLAALYPDAITLQATEKLLVMEEVCGVPDNVQHWITVAKDEAEAQCMTELFLHHRHGYAGTRHGARKVSVQSMKVQDPLYNGPSDMELEDVHEENSTLCQEHPVENISDDDDNVCAFVEHHPPCVLEDDSHDDKQDPGAWEVDDYELLFDNDSRQVNLAEASLNDQNECVGCADDMAMRKNLQQRVSALLGNGTPFVSTCGPGVQPFSDYDPKWMMYVHFWLFPYGVGSWRYGDDKGEERLSMEEWMYILLRRPKEDKFCQASLFIMDGFNIIQRHKVNSETKFHLRFNKSSLSEIGGLREEDMELVIDILQKGLYAGGLKQRLKSAKPGVKALLKCIRQTSAKVPGSPQSFLSLRSRVAGSWAVYGPWTVFITINPGEGTGKLVFEAGGYKFLHDDMGFVTNLPNYTDRMRMVVKNPVACALFFQAVVDAFDDVLLGWPKGAHEQTNPGCLFGPIACKYWKQETSGRGGLHMHGQAVQLDMRPEKMKGYMSGEWREKFIEYMESVMCQVIPPLDPKCRSLAGAGPTQLVCREIPLHIASQAECASGNTPTVASCDLDHHVKECVEALQLHVHSHTCAKGKGEANDEKCRLAMPRPKIHSTFVDEESGCVILRRNHQRVVAYLPEVMLAIPMNHAIYLTVEQGRWARAMALHNQALEKGMDSSMPPMPDCVESAYEVACYVEKYACKVDNVKLLDGFLAGAFMCRDQDPMHKKEDADHGLKLLRFVMNKVHGSVGYSALACARYLLKHGDSSMSHATAIHAHLTFMTGLKDMCDDDVEVLHERCKNGWVTAYIDYKCRPIQLRHLSAIMFTCFFVKERQDALFTRGLNKRKRGEDENVTGLASPCKPEAGYARYAFQPEHPQHGTHMVRRVGKFMLPQFISDAPVMPLSDGESSEETKEAYGLFAVANLVPDCLLPLKQDEQSYWEFWQYLRGHDWVDANGEPVPGKDVCLKLADNINSRVRLRKGGEQKACLQRHNLQNAEKATVVLAQQDGCSEVPFFCFDDEDGEDGMDGIHGHGIQMDEEHAEEKTVLCFDSTDQEAHLLEMFTNQVQHASERNGVAQYLHDVQNLFTEDAAVFDPAEVGNVPISGTAQPTSFEKNVSHTVFLSGTKAHSRRLITVRFKSE